MSRAALFNNAPDMASFNNMMMQSAAARSSAMAPVTPDKAGSLSSRKAVKSTSSKVSEDGDDGKDSDNVSIATFAGDDDIFSDFLDEKVDDLSGIF